MRLINLAATALALIASHLITPGYAATSDDAPKAKPTKPCTIRSPVTDRYFDLTPIWAVLPAAKDAKKSKTEHVERDESWHARGYDYGANFTLNFCGPVVEKLEDVEGVSKSSWGNISAFYIKAGKTYSMGMPNAQPVFRGRKLILNYTDGSPCGASSDKRNSPRAWTDDDDDDDSFDRDGDKDKDKDKPKSSPSDQRKKTTIISLLCETDPLAAKAAVSFVAATEDECTYMFEARTHAACGTIEKEAQTLSPGGVFGVIFLIAIAVYMVGGCMYQRTVMHQRGWRQLPNYSVWAGIWGFVRDFVIIFTSSCARLIPSRRGRGGGYSRVSNANGYGRPRSNHSDDENRLIDQLDEEWDD